jgi:chromosomal replication initiation ATPase DnaA
MTPEIYIGSPAYVRDAFIRDTPVTNYAMLHPVIKIVCQVSGFNYQQLCSTSRAAQLVAARQCAMYYLHKSGITLSETGRMLKHHHATVIYAVRQYKQRVSTAGYQEYAAIDAEVKELLKVYMAT